MFEPEKAADDLFQGSPGDIATQNAKTLHGAIQVLEGWQDFLERAQGSREGERETIQECIDSVQEAYDKVSELYPILATQAALIKVQERQQTDTDLDPERDRTFG